MSYLEMAKQVSAQIAAYKAALWTWWTLTAQGADADEADVEATYQQILSLIDELGPTSATQLRLEHEIHWYKQTGRCPRCGNEGERHTA
jgi:hypothetical protein